MTDAEAAYNFNAGVVAGTETPVTAKTVSGSENGSWGTRTQSLADIDNVAFDVDVKLVSFDPTARAVESYVIDNQSVVFSGQNIYDAWNKCPGHSGLDFVTDLDGNMVKVILEGQKLISERAYDPAIDDGAYSFTITPENLDNESTPVPVEDTVTNN